MEQRISAILLAGGESSRMGRNKAGLDYHGVSFIQHQTSKLRSLGIEDIVIAGTTFHPEGCRAISDVYPRRGPLSGIHAGLLAIRESAALVLAIDTPLVPVELLKELIDIHTTGITIATCNGTPEPLIGVYDKSLAEACEAALQSEKTSVQRFCRAVGYTPLGFTGDPALLTNCNTPEDYEKLLEIEMRESKNG